jgi:hypothetical protein
MGIPKPTLPSSAHQLWLGSYYIKQQLGLAVFPQVRNLGPDGNHNNLIVPIKTALVLSFSVRPPGNIYGAVELDVPQCIQRGIATNISIPSGSAVPSIGAALGLELLSQEATAAISAVTRFYV